MKNLAILAVAFAALAIAGCGSQSGPAATEGGQAAAQPSKQGMTNAQAGELQPPPNAPNPDDIIGSR